MKAFVTGSTGLLGSNLVHMLVEQGCEVKALSRRREKGERLLGETGAQIIVGDMEAIDAWAHEMADCDVLFHCAAYFREYYAPGEHWPILKKVNVQGTADILRAAEAQGVGKVIYVSSGGVLDYPHDGTPVDESASYLPDDTKNLYFKSKVHAEHEVYRFLEGSDLPVVLILPGWMHGPRDSGPTAAGQIVLDMVAGDLPGTIDGGAMAVDVRDVVQGMINAVEDGKSGERYLIAGRHATLEEIARIVAEITGQPAPRMKIPAPAAVAVAWVSETTARLTGGETVMTVNGIRTMQRGLHERADSTKAERELGVTFRPLADTLRASVRWFEENGYVTG